MRNWIVGGFFLFLSAIIFYAALLLFLSYIPSQYVHTFIVWLRLPVLLAHYQYIVMNPFPILIDNIIFLTYLMTSTRVLDFAIASCLCGKPNQIAFIYTKLAICNCKTIIIQYTVCRNNKCLVVVVFIVHSRLISSLNASRASSKAKNIDRSSAFHFLIVYKQRRQSAKSSRRLDKSFPRYFYKWCAAPDKISVLERQSKQNIANNNNNNATDEFQVS